ADQRGSRGRRQQAAQNSDGSRLPCPVRPQKPENLARLHAHRHTVDGYKIAESLGELIDFDRGLAVGHAPTCATVAIKTSSSDGSILSNEPGSKTVSGAVPSTRSTCSAGPDGSTLKTPGRARRVSRTRIRSGACTRYQLPESFRRTG